MGLFIINKPTESIPLPEKKSSSTRPRRSANPTALPSKPDIIAFLNAADGDAVRRDLARHFGVKGAARAELRTLLKQMDADGLINLKTGKRIAVAGRLAPVLPIDVISVDDDGELECEPADWRDDHRAPMIRIAATHAAKRKPPPGIGDRVLARLTPAGDNSYEAVIIKEIGKGAHRFLAVYNARRGGATADPVERRAKGHFTIASGDDGGAKDGDLVWIETKNERGYGPRKARVRSIAGHIDDTHAFSTIALANQDIRTEFPASVLEEAQKAQLPDADGFTDLRDTPLFTIDPSDAKDHDDAVFAEPDPNPDNPGGHRVIVAIADVSYFVRPGSALDTEALERANSVYLPDRVVPMLPERLSNDLCSLREHEDRPCLAVDMIIDAQGVKKSHRFVRAIMRSAVKLSYEEAQAISEGAPASAEIKTAVKNLYSAFKARWSERGKRAPLDLDLPERKIIMNKKGGVEKVVKRERFDAHRVIEEFMILANVAAAETLERARTPLIYRVHDQPDEEALNGVREYLKSLDYSLSKGGAVRPANFNQLLKIASERDEKEMVSEVVLRSQRQAIYATENLGHFGLNLPRYAHFTSPIRRYADLTVHRALVKACKLGPGGQGAEEAKALGDIADQISTLERRAMAAEREANDRYLSAFLEARVGASFNARIRGVTRFGLFVMLDETGADGFIPIRNLGNEYYRYEEAMHCVIGSASGGVFRLGQEVRVKLAEATPLTGGLRFDMLSNPLPGGQKRKSATKKSGSKGAKKSNRRSATSAPVKKKKKRRKSNAKPRKD